MDDLLENENFRSAYGIFREQIELAFEDYDSDTFSKICEVLENLKEQANIIDNEAWKLENPHDDGDFAIDIYNNN